MKVSGTTTLLALGLAAQQAAATWDLGASSFSCPQNTNNDCSSEQHHGFDWGSLNSGDDVNHYGGFDFSGFQCSDSFAKRDVLQARGFQSKCITGSVPYGSGSSSGGPQMSCGKEFSIKDFQVTTDRDTDVTFCYGMPDGSTCKSTHSCSSSGTYVSNDQCGGATSVGWEIPDHEGSGEGCGIGFHGIGFHCGSASSSIPYTPSSTPSPYTSTYSPPVYTTPVYSSPVESSSVPVYSSPVYSSSLTSPVESSSVYTPPVYSTPVYSSPIYSSPIGSSSIPVPSSSYGISSSSIYVPSSSVYVPSSSSVYVPSSSSVYVPSSSIVSASSSVPVTSPVSTPVYSSSVGVPGTTSTTVMTYTTLTTCPAGHTYTSGSSTYTLPTPSTSTIVITSTSTICTKCTGFTTLPTESAPIPTGSSSLTSPVESSSVYTPGTYTVPAGPSGTPATYTVPSVPSGKTSIYTVPAGPSGTPATYTVTGGVPSKSSIEVSPTSSSSPAPPQAECPGVLAKCMNTWIFKTGCKNNMDYSCYCPHKEYTKMVIQCVDAWSQSESEKSAAMSCMAGICAPYIPQNPGIITHVPSTVTVCPTTTPTGYTGVSSVVSTVTTGVPATSIVSVSSTVYGPTSAGSVTVPASTITLTTTQTSTCTEASCTGTSVVYSTGATTVTIPQVHFTTETVTGPGYTSTVPGLAPGTPAPVPASSTPYYPVPSSLSSVYGPYPTGGAPAPSSAQPSSTAPIPTGAAGKVSAGSVGSIIAGAVAAMFFL